MSSLNLPTTPGSRLRRLFSARASRKFLTVASLAPDCLLSSWTMAFLSSAVRVGADRMVLSLVSFSTRAPSLFRAWAVGSRFDDLTAAVYYRFSLLLVSWSVVWRFMTSSAWFSCLNPQLNGRNWQATNGMAPIQFNAGSDSSSIPPLFSFASPSTIQTPEAGFEFSHTRAVA